MTRLFSGTPTQAPSYTTQNTETPRWMQDAIYNQIQWATNIANTPFQGYDMPRVAEMSPLQQQAYRAVAENQGAWQPTYGSAVSGTQELAGAGTTGRLAARQEDYLRPDMVGQEFNAARNLYRQAGEQSVYGAAEPFLSQAGGIDIQQAASPFLRRAADVDIQGAGADAFGATGQLDAVQAASPFLRRAADMSATGAAFPFINQGARTGFIK